MHASQEKRKKNKIYVFFRYFILNTYITGLNKFKVNYNYIKVYLLPSQVNKYENNTPEMV